MTTTPNKKNLKVREYIIDNLLSQGYVIDSYGNLKQTVDGKEYRYKFNSTSFRYELKINSNPVSWIRIKSMYYKDVKIKGINSLN